MEPVPLTPSGTGMSGTPTPAASRAPPIATKLIRASALAKPRDLVCDAGPPACNRAGIWSRLAQVGSLVVAQPSRRVLLGEKQSSREGIHRDWDLHQQARLGFEDLAGFVLREGALQLRRACEPGQDGAAR